jgi:hypothetical protein
MLLFLEQKHLASVVEYFSRGLCIALTIGLFASVELAMLFACLAGAAANTAYCVGPTLLVDPNQWSIFFES